MVYSIGHIYKIICSLDNNFIYIGSTFNELRHRFSKHKENYKCWIDNGRTTKFKHTYYDLVDKYGFENFKIIKIKSYLVYRENNKDRKHLSVYETLWINKTKNCINRIPFTINLKKPKVLNIKSAIHDPKYKNYTFPNQVRYYDNNKKEILEKMKKKHSKIVNCPICNLKLTYGSLSRHKKRKH